jgi:hypothetical protein
LISRPGNLAHQTTDDRRMTDDEEIVLAPLELKNDGFEPDYRIKFQVSLLSAGGENCSCYAPLRS